ncbi:MAG: hypothetical protein HGB11_01335 [Chlorobiales bacterium]|nr:hypothetical protein [Chlorobiales bacterium]
MKSFSGTTFFVNQWTVTSSEVVPEVAEKELLALEEDTVESDDVIDEEEGMDEAD